MSGRDLSELCFAKIYRSDIYRPPEDICGQFSYWKRASTAMNQLKASCKSVSFFFVVKDPRSRSGHLLKDGHEEGPLQILARKSADTILHEIICTVELIWNFQQCKHQSYRIVSNQNMIGCQYLVYVLKGRTIKFRTHQGDIWDSRNTGQVQGKGISTCWQFGDIGVFFFINEIMEG